MRRTLVLLATLALALGLAAPAALAAEPAFQHTGRVLIAADGDITVPAGEQADAVIVINGTATVLGEVNTVVAIDGTAELTGARVETLVAIRSPVMLGDGSEVTGDVLKLDSLVTKNGTGDVTGAIRDIGVEAAGLGFVLAPAFMLLFVGFGIAAIAAVLLLAALAARQVRAAEALISREPLATFVMGLAGVFLPILVGVMLFVTIVGAPLAAGLLFGLLPLTAFVGYLVAAIWIGDWLIRRFASNGAPERERPYLAGVIGVIVLQALAILPFLSGIASLFGFGAVLLLAWRTFRGRPQGTVSLPRTAPAPLAG